MLKLESLLPGIEIDEFILSSRMEVRIRLKEGDDEMEILLERLKNNGLSIKKEKDYYVLFPSDGESRGIIFDYISRKKSKGKEKYRDV